MHTNSSEGNKQEIHENNMTHWLDRTIMNQIVKIQINVDFSRDVLAHLFISKCSHTSHSHSIVILILFLFILEKRKSLQSNKESIIEIDIPHTDI